jgi:hypothetical protein
MSQIIDGKTVNGIKYFKYQPDVAGANPYFITYREGKLFYSNSISRTTTRKDFNRPVKYDTNSKRLLVGPFNLDPKNKQYSSELRRLDKLLDMNEYQEIYLKAATIPAQTQALSIGAEPEPKPEQKSKNPIDNINDDNVVYPIYHWGFGKGSDNPMLVYQENGQTFLRRLKKDYKNFKGDDRFYKYDDGKKRTYVAKYNKEKGVAEDLSLRIDDHKPLGSKNNLNTPSAYRNMDYQFGGGETNLRFKTKSKNPKLIDFGTRKIPTQDHTTYTGTQGITITDDKKNNINYVAGMTQEERNQADLPSTDSMDNREVRFPKSRSYDYVVLNSGGDEPNKFEFIVRKGDKLYLTNSLPRNVNDISTMRPITYNKVSGNFDIQDETGAPSRRLSKDKLQFLSGMGKNSITGKDMSRNSINDGLENFAQRKLQAKPEPKAPITPPAQPDIVDEMIKKDEPQTPISLSPRNQKTSAEPKTPDLKPNDVPNENLEQIPPETRGDATGQVKDVGNVESITQQDQGVQLVSQDEVNLNVVDEKEINPYYTEPEIDTTIDLKKPDGTKLNSEEVEKMKSSYNIDRYDTENQSKSFVEYYNELLRQYPKKLEYYLNESDILGSSFMTFLSNIEDTMEAGEMDLYQFYGNDLYKGATRSVPLVLNPNFTDQPDVDYVLQDRYTEDSFGAVILGSLMFRALKKEKVVLKNEDGDGIIQETYLDHTDNALKSRVANNFYTAAKMDLTQLRFYVCISLAAIYSMRQKKLKPHRLNNTIIRIINSIPYIKYQIPQKDVENLLQDFKKMYVNHPMPFRFSTLSQFYEQVVTYVFEIKPDINFEYLFNHISDDLKKLIPAIEKAFRTRQNFKEFLLRLYENTKKNNERFLEFSEFIKGRRNLTAQSFSQKFSDGGKIFDDNEQGEEYEIFNDDTGELVERVLIPFDPSKKAITLFINEEGRMYEAREEEREDFNIKTDIDDEEGTERFKTDILREQELPDTFMDKLKGIGQPFLKAIMVGAVGQSIGKLFKDANRDEMLEAGLARINFVTAMDKLRLLGYDPQRYISQEQVDKITYNNQMIEGGFNPAVFGNLGEAGLYPTPDLDKALLSKKVESIAFPQDFLGKFYRNVPSFDEILRMAGANTMMNVAGPVQQAPTLMRGDSTGDFGGGGRIPYDQLMENLPEAPDPTQQLLDRNVMVPTFVAETGHIQYFDPAANQVAQPSVFRDVSGAHNAHKMIIRPANIGRINLIPNTFKIFDNVFYKLTFGGLDNQMWVGINPLFLVPLRPILAVGAGVIISNYLLRKTTPLERIRERNRRGDKILDLSIGRPLDISSRVGLKAIIDNADKVFFHTFELKKYEHYFFKFVRGFKKVNLKENWQNLYMREIIDPFFQKYGKFMNKEEKFNEISRFVISAQSFDQGFDQRLYTPSTADLFMDNLRKSLTERAYRAISTPYNETEKRDFWIVFESLTFRFRKLVFEQHNLSYEDLEQGTKLLESNNFVSTLNRLDFIADELPDVKQDKIFNEHIEDKTDMIMNKELVPRKSDLRYLNLAKLSYQVNQIGYEMMTLFPKPLLEKDKQQPNLRKAYKLTRIPNDILQKFNLKADKLTKNFNIFQPEYYTDDLRDFVLIISKDRQRALIGVAGSKMSFSAGTIRDWAITNFMNLDVGVGLISQFRARAKIIFDTIKETIQDNTEVYIAGHSMGAAVANNLAFRLNEFKYNLKIHIQGFATPAFLTKSEIEKFKTSMKNVLYKNYYIYNDIVGKIGVNLNPPDNNNIILYEDGWKEVELKHRYFNSLRKAKDTFTQNTHAIILYGKYLRIAVSKGEVKDEKEETKNDEIFNFNQAEFLVKNPDIDASQLIKLMDPINHKRIREEMERYGIDLPDAIRQMLRKHQQDKQEHQQIPKPAQMTNFSDGAVPSQDAPVGSDWINYIKNLDLLKYFGKPEEEL